MCTKFAVTGCHYRSSGCCRLRCRRDSYWARKAKQTAPTNLIRYPRTAFSETAGSLRALQLDTCLYRSGYKFCILGHTRSVKMAHKRIYSDNIGSRPPSPPRVKVLLRRRNKLRRRGRSTEADVLSTKIGKLKARLHCQLIACNRLNSTD